MQLQSKSGYAENDIIIRCVFDANGLTHTKNGAYLEELKDLRPPYRNFTSGTPIDIVCSNIEVNHGITLSANELVDYVVKYVSGKNKTAGLSKYF